MCCYAVGYSKKRKGDGTVPWGAPVLVIITSDNVEVDIIVMMAKLR